MNMAVACVISEMQMFFPSWTDYFQFVKQLPSGAQENSQETVLLQ